MKIKTIGIKYPQQRLVLDKVPGIDYCKIQNYANPFLKKFKRFEVWKPIGDFGVDGYHTVNTVMLTSKPWCCSFEDYVPRGAVKEFWELAYHDNSIAPNKRIDKMVETIARPNCKRLIALSECNLRMQLHFYEKYYNAELINELYPKTCTLKVPQTLLVSHIKKLDNSSEGVKFVFVGNDFVRKGGREILEVFRELRKIRSDFDLTLITIIEKNRNYMFWGHQDSIAELDEIRNWAKEQDWIHIHSHIPNSKVLEIIKQCHVGLLPTWHDTYGYSVLEMQACGLPVISTNVRAMPEINRYGWQLNMPTSKFNEMQVTSQEQKKELRKLMQKQLYDLALEILDDHNIIYRKAIDSYEYIKQNHSPKDYANKLAAIYSEFQ